MKLIDRYATAHKVEVDSFFGHGRGLVHDLPQLYERLHRYSHYRLLLLIVACIVSHFCNAEQYLLLTPPEGWRTVERKELPPSVKCMVIGKGNYELPPSINLGTETYQGSLKNYLKRVKEINHNRHSEFKDLGCIETAAGSASLSQVDQKTEWGHLRMMHLILKQEETIYIVTAAARKEEFANFYTVFFDALKSLRFSNTVESGQPH